MNVEIPCRFVETKRKYDNQFTIAIFKTSKSNIPKEFLEKDDRRRKISVSVKGYDIPTPKDFDVLLNGEFKVEPVYGYTIVVNSAQIIQPTDIEGIQQYLIDCVDGIGPKVAKRMTDVFGEDTLKVLENNPERLSEIPRLRKNSIEKILTSYELTKGNSELIKLLTPFGITSKASMDIKLFLTKRNRKISAVEQLKENPFILAEINGLSFSILDSISSRFGCNPAHKDRIASCIIDELKMVQTNGHLFLPQKQLVSSVLRRLNDGFYQQVVYYDDVKSVMFDMARSGRLCGDYGNAYLPNNYYFEKKSAEIVNEFLNTKCNRTKNDAYIILAERKMGVEFAPKQVEAINMAVNNPLSIIVGCAGTGKTTVLKAILNVLYRKGYKPEDIVLAAPTGKAAQRMIEATGHSASTIHSALGLKADVDTKPEDIVELNAKMLIVDEFSMTDMYVTYRILSSVNPEKTKLLFLGDTAQLPSVGAGNVLYELIRSGKVPYTVLDVIYRQSFDNVIIKNASNIRYGIRSIATNDNFQIITEPLPQNVVDIITRLYKQSIEKNGYENVVVLSPLKKKGLCATNNLNSQLQEAINSPSPDKTERKVGRTLFRVNDRVMQNKNISAEDAINGREVQISNGDTGYIVSIKNNDGNYIFRIDFGLGRVVDFNFEDMFNVELAYAITIHKSQGSQYTDVIIPILDYFDNMLYRNLLYTGVTRATENVMIVGSPNCIYRCIDNNRIVKRNTNLGNRVKELQKEEVS